MSQWIVDSFKDRYHIYWALRAWSTKGHGTFIITIKEDKGNLSYAQIRPRLCNRLSQSLCINEACELVSWWSCWQILSICFLGANGSPSDLDNLEKLRLADIFCIWILVAQSNIHWCWARFTIALPRRDLHSIHIKTSNTSDMGCVVQHQPQLQNSLTERKN